MAIKQMKRCSASLVLKRKANQMYNEISPHIDQNGHIENPTTMRSAEWWRKGNPPILLVGMSVSTLTRENIMEVLKKPNMEVPSDPAIPYLGVNPEETKI